MKNKDKKNKKKEWPPTLEEYLAGQEHSTTSESEVYLPNTNVNLPFVKINSITAVEGEIDKATAAKEINLLPMDTMVPQPVQMMDVDTPEEAHIHQNNASTSQVRR